MSRNAWFVALGSLFAALVLVAAWVIRTPSPAPPAPEPQVYGAPSASPEPEVSQGDRLMADLMAATSPSAAFALLRHGFSEVGQGNHVNAVALLATWADKRLRWDDLERVPGTTVGKAQKDPDAERGKRLCVAGAIVEIHADRSIGPTLYQGGMMVAGDVVRFIAVRSTGDLVAQSAARFCGLVTGRESYQNTRGNTVHATQAVGIFDLPENRKP